MTEKLEFLSFKGFDDRFLDEKTYETASYLYSNQILKGSFDEKYHDIFQSIYFMCNPWISFFLIKDNTPIGVYLLLGKDLSIKDKNSKYYDKTGIEGLALGILPEYRSKGYGNKMIDHSLGIVLTSNHDYIWGLQYDSLNNLDNWLTKRELIHKGAINITARYLWDLSLNQLLRIHKNYYGFFNKKVTIEFFIQKGFLKEEIEKNILEIENESM